MLEHIFGKLTLSAFPLDNPIIRNADIFMILCAVAVVATITIMGKWKYIWTEWITSVDHKKIGTMYIILAGVMLLRGFSDAALMRTQQALSVGTHYGFLPAGHFSQIFSAHGVIMIFFMAMPLMFGIINWATPLLIGARDVAYPYMNSLSLWLTIVGAMLVNISLLIGSFAKTGWLAYPPLSELKFSPGVGVDYYIWALQIAGVGTLLSSINFFVTIVKLRAPGMTFMRMPVFVWTVLCAMILVMLAFPVLTATLGMLALDRVLGMHFFTAGAGGNAMMYINLIWAWGHPEVYILILPAFGMFSEVVATFCKKKLFGYATMVGATVAITFLSFVVWLHHFFTMGAGANVNAFFGIATMVIAVPTGVKIFNWLFTMYKGKVQFTTPMLWTIGFLLTFVIGGMTGVLMAVPGADFQLHNSVFLVAHFHNVIIGGVVFGYFAGFIYWFPKIFGFKLHEGLGKCAFWCWLVGYIVAFAPLYVVGLKGMTRRLYHYSVASGYHPYLVVAFTGMLIVACAIALQVTQVIVSIIQRKKLRVEGDAWGSGRTLEWGISSPPPFYNFDVTPVVHGRDAWWDIKERKARGETIPQPEITDIHMPHNTGMGFIIAVFSGVFGFALTWHIWWLVAVGFIGMVATIIARTTNKNVDYYVKAEEVKKINAANSAGGQ